MKVTMIASSLSGRYWLKGHIFPVTNILDQSIKGSICFSWIKARFLFSQLLIFQRSGRGEAQNAIPKSLVLPKIAWMTLGKSQRADSASAPTSSTVSKPHPLRPGECSANIPRVIKWWSWCCVSIGLIIKTTYSLPPLTHSNDRPVTSWLWSEIVSSYPKEVSKEERHIDFSNTTRVALQIPVMKKENNWKDYALQLQVISVWGHLILQWKAGS